MVTLAICSCYLQAARMTPPGLVLASQDSGKVNGMGYSLGILSQQALKNLSSMLKVYGKLLYF